MSKKITFLLVMFAAMLLTLPSYALGRGQESSHGNDAKVVRALKNGLKITPAEMEVNKQALFDRVKDNAVQNGGGNSVDFPIGAWDWDAHALKPFSHKWAIAAKQREGLEINVRGENSHRGNTFGGNTINRAASVDSHGIITEPDEGIHKFYKRSGWAYYPEGTTVYYKVQSGYVEIVETADGTVYIKDIVSLYVQNAWVKGTKSGNTITVEAGQPLSYNSNWGTTLSVNWGTLTNGAFKREESAITFTIDGDVITLNDSNEDRMIGIFWDDDNSFDGYGDYETVWKLNENYVPPTPVELPEDATVESWYADGTTDANFVPEEISVAFVGNDVYVSGIFADFPNSWIKGTIEGGKVTFPTLQYLGYHDEYLADCWLYVANIIEDSEDGYVPLEAVTFTYDAVNKTMKMDPNQIMALNGDEDRLLYIEYIDNLTISANPIEHDAITAPYTADFTKFYTIGDFIIIDNNNDLHTWKWNAENYAFYSYNSTLAADDYLVLPIELEAKKSYNVSINAAAELSTYAEKFEVKVGRAATAEGLNQVVIPETTVATAVFKDYEGNFITDEGGTWYVAIHVTSDPYKWNFKVKSLSIDAGADGNAPASPVLEVVPAAEGALKASCTLTAPEKSIIGEALSENMKIEIMRDDEIIATFEDVAPGAVKEFTDNSSTLTRGTHVYQAIPYNASGLGVGSEKLNVYVGEDTPNNIKNVHVTGCTANTVSFAWDPATGAHNGYVNAANVEYSIVKIEILDIMGIPFPMEGETLKTVKGVTSATVDYPIDEGERGYQYFGVKADIQGEKSSATSALTSALAGAPYELPLHESFVDEALHYIWDYKNALLVVSSDASDNDGCALALSANDPGVVALESFKLNLQNADKATLLFDAKKGTSTADKITVYGIASDGTATDITTVTLGDAYQSYNVILPESMRNDRWARIGFKAEINKANASVMIDNIMVRDLYKYDLSVAVDAPISLEAGEKATVTATVKNEGANTVNGYSVIIKAGDKELLNTVSNEALESFATAEFTAEWETTVFDDIADVAVTASVVYESDQNSDNNVADALVSVTEPTAPGVTSVTAEEAASGVIVNWVAPVLVSTKEEITEGFEEGTGGWTFIDADGDGNNWNYLYAPSYSMYSAHTGSGLMYSESYNYLTNKSYDPDNWLVSPKAALEGTFSFWASSAHSTYNKEYFQVYVSTESATDITTFVPVSEKFVTTSSYQEFTVDLSAYNGVNGWIAIRHFDSYDVYAIKIDDITYTAVTDAEEIENFNIYLDGKLAATAASDQATATIEGVEAGNHTIAVSVVYTNGKESKPVMASITTDLNKVTVFTQPVDVYSLDGKLVRRQATSFEGLKGVYIVGDRKIVFQ